MFKKQPKEIEGVVRQFLRANGLETPWLQHRVVELWDEVAGPLVAQYTEEKSIKNQTLWVKISNPALRSDLQMRRTQLAMLLNDRVGAQIVSEIKIY